MTTNESRSYLSGIAFLIAFFILVSYSVNDNEIYLKSLIYHHERGGLAVYIALCILATVVAPLSSLPFLPLVSLLYGWFWAAAASIVGWSIGAWIAFAIARVWGKELVKKFVSLAHIERLEARIPNTHLFWHIVLLRMIVPVDALSYALGLFTNIKAEPYMAATIIGITPLAFVWAYMGGMSWKYLIALGGGVLVVYVLLFTMRKKVIHT
ncbi:VTT domain-containing protein [Candidatus Azambacteria bacterium]|nr:VTT domain-containing protein [Candidatus Azambacteria bacterium]MBI3685003.1 VTT domain-containing protein [Candidatus Azambacteria bacterium]